MKAVVALLVITAAGGLGWATQASPLRMRSEAPRSQDDEYANVPYDGRFTFARIRFEATSGGMDFGGRTDLKWDHDFPRGERNFLRILEEISTIRPYPGGTNVLTLDDPELFRYPVAYLCEPGFWSPTDAEAAGLRAYLLKGGFLIVDDFAGSQWFNFETGMRRVLPGARLVRLDRSHPIFDAFYRIESLDFTHPYFGGQSEFYGIYEDNDPSRRLLVIVNYNNDIGDYWEWSDEGTLPVSVTNEAYKLGVNYVMYGMTR